MRSLAATVGVVALLGVGGCVGGGNAGQQPAWFAERAEADARGYPSLREVPTETIANTDPAHWSEVEREMAAAAAALRSHPRAQYTAPEDPAAFVEQARADLEAARQAHEPAPKPE
jgi:hypothetical protein